MDLVLKRERQYSLHGGNMHMELKERTKRNIERTTGVPFVDLLSKEPVGDPRLKKLRRGRPSAGVDPLVSGNPELTMGYITTME